MTSMLFFEKKPLKNDTHKSNFPLHKTIHIFT